MKLLEENTGEFIDELRQVFIKKTHKNWQTKKIDEIDKLKIRPYVIKKHCKRMRREGIRWEKYLQYIYM